MITTTLVDRKYLLKLTDKQREFISRWITLKMMAGTNSQRDETSRPEIIEDNEDLINHV